MSNTIDWGKIHYNSWSPETNLTGTGATPSFSNTKSIELDGIDGFVTMGDVLDMANDGTEAFSFSCWFKTTDTATQVLIGKQINTTPFNGYNISLSSNTIGFFLGTTHLNARIQGKTGTISSISNGSWHHLAITYDGSQDISGFTIYYDNASQSITTTYNNTPSGVSNTVDFNIGARDNAALFFNGNIDETSYFNSELSASDVTSIYGVGVPSSLSSYSSLISWWRCGDGDVSPTLTDNKGSNNGTMQNFTTFSTDVPT